MKTSLQKAIEKGENQKVLVVEDNTLEILNGLLGANELSQFNFRRIEKLKNSRLKDQSQTAIYFIYPTEESINAIISDFTGVSCYHSGAIISVGETPDRLFKKVARSINSFIIAWEDVLSLGFYGY